MSEDDEYELLSHTEVEHLRSQLEKYKHRKGGAASTEEIADELRRTRQAIEDLRDLLSSVKQQVLEDYADSPSPEEKLDRIVEQNKTIAKGMVNLTKRVKKLERGGMNTSAPSTVFDNTQKQDESPSQAPSPRPSIQHSKQNEHADQSQAQPLSKKSSTSDSTLRKRPGSLRSSSLRRKNNPSQPESQQKSSEADTPKKGGKPELQPITSSSGNETEAGNKFKHLNPPGSGKNGGSVHLRGVAPGENVKEALKKETNPPIAPQAPKKQQSQKKKSLFAKLMRK